MGNLIKRYKSFAYPAAIQKVQIAKANRPQIALVYN